MVEQRPLGRTGLTVGALGLGAAELGYDGVPSSDVEAMLGAALELGMTVIDTAAAYEDSEAKIGAALRGRRDRFHLFTKCGPDWRPQALARDLDESLRRLGTDHVDLLQLWAAPLDVLRRGEATAVLEAAKRAGKTRLIGYSGDGPPAAYAVECGLYDVLQTSINIADQESIDLTLPGCVARGMGVIAKRPGANVAWRIGRPAENRHDDAYWDRLGYADVYKRRLERLAYPFLALPLARGCRLRFAVYPWGARRVHGDRRNDESGATRGKRRIRRRADRCQGLRANQGALAGSERSRLGRAKNDGRRRTVKSDGPTSRMLVTFAIVASLAGCRGEPGARTPISTFHRSQRVLHLPDYDVAYVRAGRGPTLLLLHGGGTWSYSWRHNIAELARSFDVVALDMIGHGYTRRTAGGRQRYDLAETTRFLAAALDALGVRQADLVGNSWGGGWALAFAQAHPDRVRRLVLIGSSGLPGSERPVWERLKWPVVGDLMIHLVRRSDVEQGLKEALYDPVGVRGVDVDEVWGPMRTIEVRRAQVGFMRGLDWRETAARAPTTTTPTLILRGVGDHYASEASQRGLAELLPDARFLAVPRAGHVAHEERPAAVDAQITGFLAEPLVPAERRSSWCSGSAARRRRTAANVIDVVRHRGPMFIVIARSFQR